MTFAFEITPRLQMSTLVGEIILKSRRHCLGGSGSTVDLLSSAITTQTTAGMDLNGHLTRSFGRPWRPAPSSDSASSFAKVVLKNPTLRAGRAHAETKTTNVVVPFDMLALAHLQNDRIRNFLRQLHGPVSRNCSHELARSCERRECIFVPSRATNRLMTWSTFQQVRYLLHPPAG